jgi:hypothetical protein
MGMTPSQEQPQAIDLIGVFATSKDTFQETFLR